MRTGAWRPSRRRLDTNIMADMTDTQQSAECRVRERNSEFELPALSIESRSGRGISQEQTLDPV